MNVFEAMVAHLFVYYQNKNKDFDPNASHCRFIVGTVLFGYSPAIYKISKWLIKKDIYMFGRAFLSKKADFFILLALMLVTAYLLQIKISGNKHTKKGV